MVLLINSNSSCVVRLPHAFRKFGPANSGVRDRSHARVHQHGHALAEPQLAAEETEWLADSQRRRAERHPSSAAVNPTRLPGDRIATYRDHSARLVVGDPAQVAYLDPGRRHESGPSHLDHLFEGLAHGGNPRVQPPLHAHATDSDPRPRPRDDEQQAQRVGKGVLLDSRETMKRRERASAVTRATLLSRLPHLCGRAITRRKPSVEHARAPASLRPACPRSAPASPRSVEG